MRFSTEDELWKLSSWFCAVTAGSKSRRPQGRKAHFRGVLARSIEPRPLRQRSPLPRCCLGDALSVAPSAIWVTWWHAGPGDEEGKVMRGFRLHWFARCLVRFPTARLAALSLLALKSMGMADSPPAVHEPRGVGDARRRHGNGIKHSAHRGIPESRARHGDQHSSPCD